MAWNDRNTVRLTRCFEFITVEVYVESNFHVVCIELFEIHLHVVRLAFGHLDDRSFEEHVGAIRERLDQRSVYLRLSCYVRIDPVESNSDRGVVDNKCTIDHRKSHLDEARDTSRLCVIDIMLLTLG